jgi:hypothetical protein
MPSAFESWVNLLKDIALFMALTWYCDHIIQHNRGVAYPPHFMFTKKYWLSIVKKGEGFAEEGKGKKKVKKEKKKKISIEDYQEDLNLET